MQASVPAMTMSVLSRGKKLNLSAEPCTKSRTGPGRPRPSTFSSIACRANHVLARVDPGDVLERLQRDGGLT